MTKQLPARPSFAQIAVPRFYTTGFALNVVIIVENKLL
jgi:hypothetical protein